MTAVERLADFAVNTPYEKLSETARQQLKIRVLDALGCAIGAVGFVYQQGGLLVTDLASQRCAHRQRLFDRALSELPVSLQSVHQFLRKGSGACGPPFDGVKQVKCIRQRNPTLTDRKSTRLNSSHA